MLTLNQTVKLLNNFANAHRQINTFGSGEISDFATSGVTTYPVMWVDYEDPIISLNSEGSGIFRNVLRVYLADRLLKGQGNLQEVLSDMQQVGIDLFAHLQSQTYLSMQQTILEPLDYTFNLFSGSFHDDEIAGYYIDVTLKSAYTSDRCQIPYDGSTIPTPVNPNSMNFADNETPSGAINGINLTYTTSGVPIPASLYVYYNGQLQRWGVDYTISGSTITMSFAPEIGSSLIISYRY